jgi:hypothetical protein
MKEADIDIIEQYLEGSLTGESKRLLEKRLENDSAFKQDFELIRSAQKVVKKIAKEEFKVTLSKVAREYKGLEMAAVTREANSSAAAMTSSAQDLTGRMFKLSWKSLAMAAVFTGVIFASTFWLFKSDTSHILPNALADYKDNKKYNISYFEQEIVNGKYLGNFSSALGNDSFKDLKDIQNYQVAIIEDEYVEPSYFYDDTLYLIGKFDHPKLLYYELYESREMRLYLKDNFKNYYIILEETDTITRLIKTTNFQKFNPNEK